MLKGLENLHQIKRDFNKTKLKIPKLRVTGMGFDINSIANNEIMNNISEKNLLTNNHVINTVHKYENKKQKCGI